MHPEIETANKFNNHMHTCHDATTQKNTRQLNILIVRQVYARTLKEGRRHIGTVVETLRMAIQTVSAAPMAEYRQAAKPADMCMILIDDLIIVQ